jgi:hypothetical protein
MSRYVQIDTIAFNDPVRGSVNIKDTRPIPVEDVAFSEAIKKDTMLDEVAVRNGVFGVGGETQVYRLFDQNMRKIVAAGFSLENLQSLKVPKG